MLYLFKKIYFIDYAITVIPFFSPLYSPLPCTPLPPSFPQLSSCLRVIYIYKFFGFSIYPTILNLPLSILYLPLMLLTPCTFSPILPLPLPTDKPPCDIFKVLFQEKHIYNNKSSNVSKNKSKYSKTYKKT